MPIREREDRRFVLVCLVFFDELVWVAETDFFAVFVFLFGLLFFVEAARTRSALVFPFNEFLADWRFVFFLADRPAVFRMSTFLLAISLSFELLHQCIIAFLLASTDYFSKFRVDS